VTIAGIATDSELVAISKSARLMADWTETFERNTPSLSLFSFVTVASGCFWLFTTYGTTVAILQISK